MVVELYSFHLSFQGRLISMAASIQAIITNKVTNGEQYINKVEAFPIATRMYGV